MQFFQKLLIKILHLKSTSCDINFFNLKLNIDWGIHSSYKYKRLYLLFSIMFWNKIPVGKTLTVCL